MRYLITLTAGLVLWMANGAAWAQIYESRDAEGNPVFTDTPVDGSSSEVELSKTNIADAPTQNSDTGAPAADPARQGAPATASQPRPFRDPEEELYEEHESRVRAEGEPTPYDNLVGSEPQGTIDGEAPHETEGGAEPHETEGGAAPHETEGGAEPHETEGGAAPHETEGGAEPQDVGDF